MTQPHKKSSGQPSAKLAASAAERAVRNASSAAESARHSTENVVKIGSTAMREFMTTSADEAQKAQEKVFAMGRESAENLAKSADAVSKMMYELLGMSRDNIETCVECGNMTAALAKDVSTEIFESSNRAFSDTVDTSKEFFACRTLNDIAELQNRLLRQSIDNFFTESMKLSDMLFEYSTEALEPINERVNEAAEQLNKALAA